jgi:uncharacterized protein (DUF433 family)
VKRPGYCGGKAAIDDTRVRVNNVVFLHKQGKTPGEIRVTYPDLSLAQVHGALAYYYDHKEEIEAELTADADWARSTSTRRRSTSAVGPPGSGRALSDIHRRRTSTSPWWRHSSAEVGTS